MKLEELIPMENFQNYKHPKNSREIALEQRLAYAKQLLESAMLGMTGERPTKPYIRAFIEKLTKEGL